VRVEKGRKKKKKGEEEKRERGKETVKLALAGLTKITFVEQRGDLIEGKNTVLKRGGRKRVSRGGNSASFYPKGEVCR